MRVAHHWFVLLSVSVACICTADSDVPHQGKLQQPGCIGDDCPLELETKVNRRRRQLSNCTDPMTPTSLQFNPPTVTIESGRERWRYNVSWEQPESVDCISYYQTRFPAADSPIEEVNTTSREVYADGNEELTFHLVLVDTELEESAVSSATITTDLLRPQVSPTDVSLTANSPKCVRPSWQPPEYPNGPLTGYKYNCGNGWNNRSTELINQQICGFSPYQYVECHIRAVNSAGESNSATVYARTMCGAPELPLDISDYVTEEAYLPQGSIYHRRRATIDVPVREVTINCESIISARAWLAGIDPSDGFVLDDLAAVTTYTVEYQVVNNEDLASVPREVIVVTGALEPSACSVVTVQPANLSCIQFNWTKPNSPNGIITQYQYRCALNAYLSQTPFKTAKKETLVTICGYERGNEVTCAVKATTEIGYGPIAENSTVTQCLKPSRPTITVSDYVYTNNNSAERIRMDVQSVVELSNCDSIVQYSITLSSMSGVLIANKTSTASDNTFTGFNPYTMYKVQVKATNDESLTESGEIIWKTSPAKPQDSPSVKLTFNTSCVFLNISTPKIPNGNVTHYRYSCMQTKELAQPILVEVSDVDEEEPAVCGFKAAAYITCNVTAINSAGDSPAISTSGRTLLQLVYNIETYNFTEIVENDGIRDLRIILKHIEFVNMAPMIRLYRVLVGRDDDERTAVFFDEEKCNLKQMLDFTIANSIGSSCYIAAEVSSEYVTSKGFAFLLGDGTIIGGFYNAPLGSDASYSLMISVVLRTEDGTDLEYQLIPYKFIRSLPNTDLNASTILTNENHDGNKRNTVISVTVPLSVSVLLLVLAGLGIVWWKKRRSSRRQRKEIAITMSNLSQRRERQPVVRPTTSAQTTSMTNPLPRQQLPSEQTFRAQAQASRPSYHDSPRQQPPSKKTFRDPVQVPRHSCHGPPRQQHQPVVRPTTSAQPTSMTNPFSSHDYSNIDELQPPSEQPFKVPVQVPPILNAPPWQQHQSKERPPTPIQPTSTINTLQRQQHPLEQISGTLVQVLPNEYPSKRSDSIKYTEVVHNNIEQNMKDSPKGIDDRNVEIESESASTKDISAHSIPNRDTGSIDGLSTDAEHDLLIASPQMNGQRQVGENDSMTTMKSDIQADVHEEFLNIEAELDNEEQYLNDKKVNRRRNRDTHNLPDKRYAPKVDGEGYFNGTMIDSNRLQDHVIATQLPLENTKEDFWIIMKQYMIKEVVQLESEKKFESYMFAGDHIIVQMLEENELMTIKSVNVHDYTVTLMSMHDWPSAEPSLPNKESMMRCIRTLYKYQCDGGNQRFCVMDMDGSTRCGLFIAAYNIMMMCKEPEESRDTVRSQIMSIRLRCRRCLDSVEQHQFIHQLHSAYNSQYPRRYDISEHVGTATETDNSQYYSSVPPTDGNEQPYSSPCKRADLHDEFERVEKELDTHNPDFTRGNEKWNRSKNRYTFNLPDERYAPTTPENGYFNGTMFNSDGSENHIIATQLPLKHTKDDFWKVMEYCDIRLIVQLDSSEAIESYLCAGDEISVKQLKKDEYMTRRSVNVHGYPVTLLSIHNWSTGGKRLPNKKSMLSYIRKLHNLQKDGGNGKICVMDMDGSTRCGLFIAAYNILMMCKKPESRDTVRSQIMNIRSRCRRCLSDITHHEYIHMLHEELRGELQ